MKTTIEISEPLMHRARELAAEQGTTLRALIEQGLREIIEKRTAQEPFRLHDASFGGEGMAAEFAEGGWPRIRDAVYSGRGS